MENIQEKYNRTVVHCPTIEIAKKVEAKINILFSRNENLAEPSYGIYTNRSCLRIDQPSYSPKDYWIQSGFKVISAEEFLNVENKIVDNYSIY